MPVDQRFNFRNWLEYFSNTGNSTLRSVTDEVVRRVLTLLGAPPLDTDPPGAPTDLVATGGIESTGLSWTPPGDLDVVRYRVQQSTSSGSGFSTIAETAATTQNAVGLTGGTRYYFKVAAIDDAGNVGPYSAEASTVPTASGGSGTPPGAPQGLLAEPGNTVVNLTWSQPDPTAVSHSVYRHTASGGPYTLVVAGLTTLSYQDTGRTNGTAYYYVVTSTNGNGDESGYSLEATATPFAETNPAPNKVTGLVGSPAYASVELQWDILPETDIDYYLVEAGASSGVYTLTWEIPSGRAANDEYFKLTVPVPAGVKYYFTVSAFDTAGTQGLKATEISVTNLGAAPGSPVAPAAPTGVITTDEGDGYVSIAWNANGESNMQSYRVFRNNGTGTGYIQIATVNIPNVAYTATQLTNGISYAFAVQAVNTSGQGSGLSIPTYGTPDGSTTGGGGGSTPGGGTGTGGLFSGDTGLGSRHKAPGATFDYVIDVSNETTGGFLWSRIASAAQLATVGNPNFFDNKRVAILLPERTFNINQYTQDGATTPFPVTEGARGLSFNVGAGNRYMACDLPRADNLQWHFIAPWPTASLSDSNAAAKAATKKFLLECKTPDGKAMFQADNAQSGNWGMTMTNRGRLGMRFGFWFMEVAGWGAATLTGDVLHNPIGNGGGMKLTLFGCDWTHRNPFPGGTNPGLNNNKTPRWGISTWGILYDYIQYCKFDMPWNSEHIFYERNPPIGDSFVEDCDFNNSGASCFQTALRVIGVDGATDLTNGQEAGTALFARCKFENYARSSWGTAAITWYTAHRHLRFEDCVWMSQAVGKVVNWPPANPLLNPLPEGTNIDSGGQDFMAVGTQEIGGFLPDGHGNLSVTMDGCLGYQRLSQDGAVRINSARVVTITDCGIYPHASATREPVKLTRRREGCLAATLINSFTINTCNQAGHLTALRALYPSIVPVSDANLKLAGRVRSFYPVGFPEVRDDGVYTDHGPLDTVNVSNLVLP